MRKIFLSIGGEKPARNALVSATWTAVGALALLAVYQARELGDDRAALTHAPNIGVVKNSAAGSATVPSSAELALERLVRAHAASRFAGWNDALTSLAAALPSSVTIERITLNAKTGRGDATLRVARVEEVSRTVEALESAPSFSSTTARRCEQARARDQTGMRCELAFNWARKAE